MRTLLALCCLVAVASALPKKNLFPAKVRFPHMLTMGSDAGLDHEFRDARIHDGEPAEEGQFPFIAAVEIDALYFCGSSVISADYLISAGHCVDGALFLDITAGTINWRDGSGWKQRTTTFQAHEDFYNGVQGIGNDISYILLEEPLPLDDTDLLDSIPIADADPDIQDPVTLIGWGAECATCSVSTTLNYVHGLLVRTDDVMNIFAGDIPPEQFVCTYGWTVGGGSCGGDSGGPGVIGDTGADGHVTGPLYGATSFGAQDCVKGPSCYTSLSYFREWIRDNTGI